MEFKPVATGTVTPQQMAVDLSNKLKQLAGMPIEDIQHMIEAHGFRVSSVRNGYAFSLVFCDDRDFPAVIHGMMLGLNDDQWAGLAVSIRPLMLDVFRRRAERDPSMVSRLPTILGEAAQVIQEAALSGTAPVGSTN